MAIINFNGGQTAGLETTAKLNLSWRYSLKPLNQCQIKNELKISTSPADKNDSPLNAWQRPNREPKEMVMNFTTWSRKPICLPNLAVFFWSLLLLANLFLNACNSEESASVKPRARVPGNVVSNPSTSGATETGGNGKEFGNESGVPNSIQNGQSNPTQVLPLASATSLAFVPADSFGSFLTYEINPVNRTFTFHCPGDSVYSGYKSTYDIKSHDRKFAFYCQFMQDNRNLALRKNNCKTYEPTAKFLGQNQKFSCPSGTFISGEESTFDGNAADRSNRYECCELYTTDDKKAIIDETPASCSNNIPVQLAALGGSWAAAINNEVNEWGGPVDFTCGNAARLAANGVDLTPVANAVLYQVSSRYNGTEKDRMYSYKCCPLKFE